MSNRTGLYTPELGEEICRRLREGESLLAISQTKGMPHESTIRMWANDSKHPFAPNYARAREIGYMKMADEIIRIADDSTPEDVNAARLRVDARKWTLAKMLPKVFGDSLTHKGDPEAPLEVANDTNAVARRVALILARGTAQKDAAE